MSTWDVAGRVVDMPPAVLRPWCTHRLVVDDVIENDGEMPPNDCVRSCLTCGVSYDRGSALRRLERTIRDRYRLPPSPWTAEERFRDL